MDLLLDIYTTLDLGEKVHLLNYFSSLPSSNSQSLSPPSGSLAYSLLSTSSEHDPPSTSGCSSDQSARLQTQKELMKAIKELKLRLPSERKSKGHSSTLSALKYALQCVRQVRGEVSLMCFCFILSQKRYTKESGLLI